MASVSVWLHPAAVEFCKEDAREADMCCLHKSSPVSLKKNRDFRIVYSQGKYISDKFFVAYALANGLTQSRLGITVSKKVGGAVVRNRVKRWVKESLRHHLVAPGYDYVVIARQSAGLLVGKGAFLQVDKSVTRLMQKLNKVSNA